jgi:flagellar hook-associated protein 3
MSSSIGGISTSRISDAFVNANLINQVQYNELQLNELETQLTTGYRFQLPSQDPTAANQVINLQNLVARKTQLQTNLTSVQSYLSATDTALTSVANLLTDARSTAAGVVGSTSTDAQRTAASQQINQILQQLVNTGNQQFNGRYLFAGSDTALQPFNLTNNGDVLYSGNETTIYSYGDVNLLFATNVTGAEAFGALSPDLGSNDLQPMVTPQTPLSNLRQGAGISSGSIAISDGHSTSVIDLSGATNVGDVARLIAANPPTGRSLSVQVTATGLNIAINPDPNFDPASDNLSIKEVSGGSTARHLGIYAPNGVGNGAIIGEDLQPIIQATTPLANLLGTRATAQVVVPGQNSNFSLQAISNGSDTADGTLLNGVTLQFRGDAPAAGEETVDFDPGDPTTPGTITVHIKAGQTSATQVIAAINTAAQLHEIPFTAALDPTDRPPAGTAAVPVTTSVQTSGGGGEVFDTTGLQITNGGQKFNISFSGANTIEDVLHILNTSGAGLCAQISRDGGGISIRSTTSGQDFEIGENGGQTATQLGVRTFDDNTLLSSLNYGAGVSNGSTSAANSSANTSSATAPKAFTITMSDGTSFKIDVTSATTVGDVRQLINAAGGTKLSATLATTGNGLVLTDESGSPGPITITEGTGSTAAEDLGLIPVGSTTATSTGSTVAGRDTNPQETTGVMNAMVRLRAALATSDTVGIQRAMSLLDQSATQVSFVRADLGAREQGVVAVQSRISSEQTDLQMSISNNYDADLTQVISDFVAKQASFQGALKVAATTMQVSMLNYI